MTSQQYVELMVCQPGIGTADPRAAQAAHPDHLLASAERLFIERGFHAASIDDIAQAAGFTKGAVYAHFRNKEDVFIALTERRWDEQLARVRTALDTLATSSADHRSASFVELTSNLLWDGWFTYLRRCRRGTMGCSRPR